MTTYKQRRALVLGLLSLGASALPGVAMAQNAAADAGTAAIPADSDVGTDIVVTAQRRQERLTDVPVSVGVVRGDDYRTFTSGGDDTLLALSGRVPGLYAESTTGRIFPRFYIRGLGNIDFYLGASQPVSIIQDDVVLEHVVLKSNPAFDIAQVEVLRGPQGSLFGRNTTAGIIKFDTNRPTMDLNGQASISVGSYGSVNMDAGIGGPIVADKIAVRASVLVQHREDYVDNTYRGPSADSTATPMKDAMGGFDDRNARLQVLLTPTETFSVLLSGHYRDYEGTSTLFLRNALVRGSNDPIAPRKSVAYDEAQNNPQAYKTKGASAHVTWDFGGAALTSITAYETTKGYSRGDTDGGAAANFPFNGVANGFGQSQGQIRDLDQWTQELRLASTGENPFKWQFGGYYFDSRDTTDFYQRAFFLTTAARNPNNWVRLRNVNTSWAVFGQASYDLTDQLTITAGARYTNDDKKTRLLKTANTVTNAVTYTGRTFVRLEDEKPSWDVSALYKVNPDVSVYARIARGFRGPTIQGRSAVFNSDFTTADSETITSYEAGFKSQLIDNTLRFNATAFYWTLKNIQLNGNDSNGNGVLFNADKAEAYGLEADLEYRPTENLSITLGGSLLHTEIKDNRVYAQVCALNGVVVCTVNDPTIRGGLFAQIDGNPLPNAPKWTVNATARYDIPVGDTSKLFIATDWNVQGYTNFVLYKTDEFYSKGNFEGGLKIGYDTGNFEVAAFARNITNEKNLKGVIENYMAAVYNEPRIIGVSLSGKIR
ncbi:iron complex outermembrane receptor protein [Novosphingobium chloroacetimidivorans]|uniref:Iron complex outermembrane receptor protein n=1 Tax=Novosphingobium chloroacetimidivorans TaxID=1428314 RepID=A0A7W7KE07_9SPHN|nr:TonB-dependent receptor [Novosphingobium chloroacetimidivorans]MBB4860514.1 iron complex outermembrane receptor protein [Novosphingobium chloroacetimidivorans]